MDKINSLTPTIILIVTSIINHIYRDNKELTIRDFMLMMSPTIPTIIPIFMSIITNSFKSVFDDLFTFLGDMEKIKNIFTYILIPYNYFFPVLQKSENIVKYHDEISNKTKCEIVRIVTSIQFVQSLIIYIKKSTDATYVVNNHDSLLKIIGNSMTETKIWKDIKINYESLQIYVNDLSISYIMNDDEIILTDYMIFENKNNQLPNKKFTRFSDFLKNDVLRSYINSISDKLKEHINISNFKYIDFFEFVVLDDVCHVCPNIDKTLFVSDLLVINKVYHIWCNSNLSDDIIKTCTTQSYLLFDYYVPTISKLNGKCSYYGNTMNDEIDKIRKQVISSHSSEIVKELIEFRTKVIPYSVNKSSNIEMKFTLMQINNENITNSSTEIDEQFKKFIKEVLTHKPKIIDGKKIKIFNTSVEKTEIVKKTKNPEYENYLEKKIMRESANRSNETNNAQTNIQNTNTDFSLLEIPQREFMEKSIEHKISTKLVNEKFKSFDTLYLRENDIRNLLNMLTKFKNGGKLFEEYELPNKLGIMLYGLPGTGKTTTIHAIASFLQKNIYYINLSTVETNEELQLVFDHVLLESVNGGIIVFEDIDAMTNIVHDRTTNKVDSDSRLTLEYFLNLLQGSLTRDGTIFIATTNHLEMLDPAFHRVGRFDVKINMKKCDHYQIKMIYKKFIGRDIDHNILKQIEIDKYTPADIIFHLVNHIDSDQSSEKIMNIFL